MTAVTRVLIAEDDDDVRALVEVIVRSAGAAVSAHRDGLSAATAARRDAPDLYVLDVRMPGMSGLELCRAIKANPHTNAPVLLMSAEASPADVAAGYAAGCQDYLPKPFSVRELRLRITQLLATTPAAA